jgi:hypothetical protein
MRDPVVCIQSPSCGGQFMTGPCWRSESFVHGKMSMVALPGVEHRQSSEMSGHVRQYGLYTVDGWVVTCNEPGVPNLIEVH